TMSLPLCRVLLLISIPCAAKNPFFMPRSIGRAFAMGSVSPVIVASARLCALEARPPKSVSATRRAAATASSRARAVRFRVRLMVPSVLSVASGARLSHLLSEGLNRRSSMWNVGSDHLGRLGRQRSELAPDQAVHVTAQVREVRELLRLDLVARPGEVDRDDLLHLGGGVREDDDAVGEVDRLVDVVRDEQDRDPVVVA